MSKKPPSAMKRGHTKSRHGCRMCKKRKIKCDEVKPKCSNCIRFNIPCDFSPLPHLPFSASKSPAEGNRRGRPRSDWAAWAEEIRLSSVKAALESQKPPPGQLNVEDLELFHNYILSTALTLDGQRIMWCERVPQLGFQHPCVLNILLAFSAYHLARKQESCSQRYLDLAEQHSTVAVQKATALLPSLNRENCPALYVTATLVCFTAFAKGPSPGDLLITAEDGQVPWLSLLRGVRLLVLTMGWPAIFSGVLADCFPQPEEDEHEPSPYAFSPTSISSWDSSLSEVLSLVDVILEPGLRDMYKIEVENLAGSFQQTFGTADFPKDGVRGKFQCVMGWLYRLDESFVEQVVKKEAVALIILGHFCVLLHTLENHWFMKGWPRHIMDEILKISTASAKWLAWPVHYLEGDKCKSTLGKSQLP